MENAKKCAHAPCECEASGESNYCSSYCKSAGDLTEVVCGCTHAACAAGTAQHSAQAASTMTSASTKANEFRDPEDRRANSDSAKRDKMFDKTLADSYPASDPPSSIPNPSEDSL